MKRIRDEPVPGEKIWKRVLLPALLERYNVADGHGHPSRPADGGAVFGRVNQPDIESFLEFSPDVVFRDEVSLLYLFDEELALPDCLCKVERRPFFPFTGDPDPVGVIADELAFHQVEDVPRPPPGLWNGDTRFRLRGTPSSRLLDFCTVFCASEADTEFCTFDLDGFRRSLYGSAA